MPMGSIPPRGNCDRVEGARIISTGQMGQRLMCRI